MAQPTSDASPPLKLTYHPERPSVSWRRNLTDTRQRLARVLRDTPSLRAQLPVLMPSVFADAREWPRLSNDREGGLSHRCAASWHIFPRMTRSSDDARRCQLQHELKTLQQSFALTRTPEHSVRILQKQTKSAPPSCLLHTFAPAL